jgi:hypothetical protein
MTDQEPTAAMAWRKIEEAPTTGREILIYCERSAMTYLASWHRTAWLISKPPGRDPNFYVVGATHFMPLPAPPAPSGSPEEDKETERGGSSSLV